MPHETDESMWAYPAHTKAKHDILDDYLGGWFAKLSGYQRVLFFDGFAGRGQYVDGSHGSPLIALRKLLTHTALDTPRMTSCEFVFMFVEKEHENAQILKAAIAQLKTEHPFPTNVQEHVIVGEFHAVAAAISASLAEQRKRQAPTFAFIDPFGYSGVPLRTIAEFTRFSGSEVFINFMVGHLQRFVTRTGQEQAVEDLFGLTPEQVMERYDNNERRAEYLRDRYVGQLRTVANFPYVNSFAMKNAGGNVTYYLIHGTRHPEGVRLMKNAMWKVDPENGSLFSDRLAAQDVLFISEPDLGVLADAMSAKFAGRADVGPEELRKFAYLETPFRDAHTIPTLKLLEQAGRVTVRRTGRAGTYTEGKTWISFP